MSRRSLRIEYCVVHDKDHWTIMFAGRPHGRFASGAGAVQLAIADAERVRRLGHEVRVTQLTKPNGHRRTVWPYDKRLTVRPQPGGGQGPKDGLRLRAFPEEHAR